MKKKLPIIRIFGVTFINIAIFILAVGGIFYGLKYGFSATFDKMESISAKRNSLDIHSTTLTVTSSTTLEDVASDLFAANIIVDEDWFIYENKFLSKSKPFIPGSYQITSDMSHTQIIELLSTEEPPEPIRLVIPEGFTVEQIALRVEGTGIATQTEFLDAVSTHNYDYDFLKDVPDGVKYPLEGYLFPDTYFVYPTDTVDMIIIRMLDQFEKVISQYTMYLHDSPYTLHEVLTVASMIEQEARLEEERAIISGVIYNRLNTGMPLQMCSTVQYSLGKRQATLTYEDLAIESPYNTYIYDGLPVGPIASVGEASIRAAFFPEEHDYFYFVLRDSTTGAHAFSSTGEEHLTNKNRYLQTEDKNFID